MKLGRRAKYSNSASQVGAFSLIVKSLLTFVCSSTRDLAQPGDILQQPGQGVEGRLLQKLLADLNMIALLYLQTLGQRNFHPQLK